MLNTAGFQTILLSGTWSEGVFCRRVELLSTSELKPPGSHIAPGPRSAGPARGQQRPKGHYAGLWENSATSGWRKNTFHPEKNGGGDKKKKRQRETGKEMMMISLQINTEMRRKEKKSEGLSRQSSSRPSWSCNLHAAPGPLITTEKERAYGYFEVLIWIFNHCSSEHYPDMHAHWVKMATGHSCYASLIMWDLIYWVKYNS